MLNKLLCPSAAILIACSACGSKSTEAYTITAEVPGLPDNTVVVFSPSTSDADESLAEAVVKNGKFKIEGVASEPRAAWVHVKDAYGYYPMIIEPGKTTIKAKGVEKVLNDTTIKYQLECIEIIGSPLSQKFKSLYSVRDSLNRIYTGIYDKYRNVSAAWGKAKMSNDKQMMDSVLASDEYKAYAQAQDEFNLTVKKTYNNVFEENKDSFWGPLMMLTYYSYFTPDQKQVFNSFSDEAKNSYYGKIVAEKLYPAGQIGDVMKDFSIDGKSLSELCKGHKVIILDFWASWCGPCRAEIPNLKRIYEKNHDKGLEIISISIDDDENSWKKALEKEDLPWINFRDADDAVAQLYKVRAVPTMYVIDGDLKLLGDNLRGEELAKAIEEMISK